MKVLCNTLKVARSGFYEWRGRPTSPRTRQDEFLSVSIKVIHQESRETYGSPRIHAELKRQGLKCGKNRVARLMAIGGIAAKTKRKFKATTDSKHRRPVAENVLNRQFTAKSPNEVWLVDITYIWTREGWLYLAAVLDLYSRRIVDWSLERRMTKEFACRALEMAINRRQPGRGLIHHSDRGSQYASGAYCVFRSKRPPNSAKAATFGIGRRRIGFCISGGRFDQVFHRLPPLHLFVALRR